MADRYWVPTSLPCRLAVVGSCAAQKTLHILVYDVAAVSKTTLTTSVWPVPPVQTPRYVGFSTSPPW